MPLKMDLGLGATLPPDVLADIRAVAGALRLTQRATILRLPAAGTTSSMGGVVQSFLPVREGEPCRIRAAKRQREVQVAEKPQAQVDLEVVFVPGTDIRPTDRLKIDGTTYDVIGTDAGRADAAVMIASVVRVQGQ